MKWLVLLLLIPAVTAGTEDSPDLTDAAGDGGDLPCSPATDLQKFWVVWTATEIQFHYIFTDLSAIEEYAAAQDATGSCFYSYTDFVLELDGERIVDSVYIDHNGFPAYQTGWRYYLHESDVGLTGSVDVATGHIQADLAYEDIGMPTDGDRIGDFRIQVTDAAAGAGVGYQTDWAPDSTQPCGCWVAYEGPDAPGEPSEGDEADEGPDTTDIEAPAEAPSKDSPGVGALLVLALLGLVARRR